MIVNEIAKFCEARPSSGELLRVAELVELLLVVAETLAAGRTRSRAHLVIPRVMAPVLFDSCVGIPVKA